MPMMSTANAAETLAREVEKARPHILVEIRAELFPRTAFSAAPNADELARHVRTDLAPEEIVDLWNVVFPDDWHVRYDEMTDEIVYNEELIGTAD